MKLMPSGIVRVEQVEGSPVGPCGSGAVLGGCPTVRPRRMRLRWSSSNTHACEGNGISRHTYNYKDLQRLACPQLSWSCPNIPLSSWLSCLLYIDR